MTLNDRIKKLEDEIKYLREQLDYIFDNIEEGKNKPFTKTGKQNKFGNQDSVFDGKSGKWKTYAVYKDDEEE